MVGAAQINQSACWTLSMNEAPAGTTFSKVSRSMLNVLLVVSPAWSTSVNRTIGLKLVELGCQMAAC